jgi:hypothetical protein
MGLKTPRGPETPLFPVITLILGSRAPGVPEMGLKTPRDPGTPLFNHKTLNLGSRAPGVHRPSWCTPRDAGTHNRVPVYRAPSFPLFPFVRGRNVHHYLNGAHSALPRPSWCTATCPLLPSPGPASSAPCRRPSFLLRLFPPAKRRSCCSPFSADRPGQRPDVLSSSTLRTVLGAGVRCRPWFRITGALRGRISTSKLVSAGLSRAPLIAAADAGASVLQPKGDPKPTSRRRRLSQNCKPLLAGYSIAIP